MIRGQVSALKAATIPLQLHGPGGHIENVTAVIDTGFDGFLTLPLELAMRLQMRYLEIRTFELGDGKDVDFDLYEASFLWDGQDRIAEALITDGGIMVGMSQLTGYRLYMDVIDGGEVLIEARP